MTSSERGLCASGTSTGRLIKGCIVLTEYRLIVSKCKNHRVGENRFGKSSIDSPFLFVSFGLFINDI